MQTTTIERRYERTATIQEWWAAKSGRVNNWLDATSRFYSRVCEFQVTRRVVLRIHMVLAALLIAAVAIEQQPLWSVMSMAVAAWIVYRMNKNKKGGELC